MCILNVFQAFLKKDKYSKFFVLLTFVKISYLFVFLLIFLTPLNLVITTIFN